jgi:hypothetical protein
MSDKIPVVSAKEFWLSFNKGRKTGVVSIKDEHDKIVKTNKTPLPKK